MNPRVLIVDDERSMCELLEADLRLRNGLDPETTKWAVSVNTPGVL